MGYAEHTAEFLKAVRGDRGELDIWLECNNEAECRAAILGALEDARRPCAELAKYFTSGNCVPVERATIMAKDFWQITGIEPTNAALTGAAHKD